MRKRKVSREIMLVQKVMGLIALLSGIALLILAKQTNGDCAAGIFVTILAVGILLTREDIIRV